MDDKLIIRKNMSITFALIGGLAGMMVLANKKYGKISSKTISFTHIFLMIFIILIEGISLEFLLQLSLDFEETLKTIYISIGFYNPLVNTILWAIITILSIVIIIVVFYIASERSEKARNLLVLLISIQFALELLRTANALYSDMPVLYVAISIVLMLIIYVPIFFFLSK